MLLTGSPSSVSPSSSTPTRSLTGCCNPYQRQPATNDAVAGLTASGLRCRPAEARLPERHDGGGHITGVGHRLRQDLDQFGRRERSAEQAILEVLLWGGVAG